MKKKVRKMSDMQRARILNKNRKVFWRLNKALSVRNTKDAMDVDKLLPLVSFGLLPPLAFADFGARMANTGTHKRNNK